MICSFEKNLIIRRLNFVLEINENIKREFGTVEDGHLHKLLGMRYDWMKTETVKSYMIMFIKDIIQERHQKSMTPQKNQA